MFVDMLHEHQYMSLREMEVKIYLLKCYNKATSEYQWCGSCSSDSENREHRKYESLIPFE